MKESISQLFPTVKRRVKSQDDIESIFRNEKYVIHDLGYTHPENPMIFFSDHMFYHCGQELDLRAFRGNSDYDFVYRIPDDLAARKEWDTTHWLFIEDWLEPVEDDS